MMGKTSIADIVARAVDPGAFKILDRGQAAAGTYTTWINAGARVQRAERKARAAIAALNAAGYRIAAADENAQVRAALKGLSDVYTSAWDLVDGGLMMMPESGVPRFEAAHREALIALGVEVYDGE